MLTVTIPAGFLIYTSSVEMACQEHWLQFLTNFMTLYENELYLCIILGEGDGHHK